MCSPIYNSPTEFKDYLPFSMIVDKTVFPLPRPQRLLTKRLDISTVYMTCWITRSLHITSSVARLRRNRVLHVNCLYNEPFYQQASGDEAGFLSVSSKDKLCICCKDFGKPTFTKATPNAVSFCEVWPMSKLIIPCII